MRKPLFKAFWIAFLTCVTTSALVETAERDQRLDVVPGGKVTAEQQRAIDIYVVELTQVLAGREINMEPLLAAAARITALFAGPVFPQEPARPRVDELSEVELNRIRRQLSGISIHIGDTIDVSPDREFYLGQARLHGGPVDMAFFALLNRSYPPSSWPVWIERTGPESGCVDFTSGELVDLFWAWQRFRSEHPGRYVDAVNDVIQELEDALFATGSRLCPQDPALVQRELRRLVRLLPEHSVSRKLGERLATVPGR